MTIEYIEEGLKYLEMLNLDGSFPYNDRERLYKEYIEYIANNPIDSELSKKANLILGREVE